jgi:hypothetical protein
MMTQIFAAWHDVGDDYRVRRFWILGIIALIIHGVLDPLVSYLAIAVFNVGQEANHLIAPYFQDGPITLLIIHIPLYAFCIGCFFVYTWLFSRGSVSERRQMYVLSLGLWCLIILWGLLLVFNNLLVLVYGLI